MDSLGNYLDCLNSLTHGQDNQMTYLNTYISGIASNLAGVPGLEHPLGFFKGCATPLENRQTD